MKKMKKGASLSKGIDDDINKDVIRSLTPLNEENKKTLGNILRVYAFCHPNIGYCQGMGFIAEFLLVLFRNEAVAYAFMDTLIEKYNMTHLFTDEIPLVKKLLYQMDRLIYLHYPNFMVNLLNEGLNSALFASAWFISIFTHILRAEDNDGLLAIWDCFLLYGWKVIFRVGIFTIKNLNKTMIEAPTVDLIQMLSKLSIFQEKSSATQFKEQFHKIKVTNRVLDLLEKEYNSIMLIGYK